MGIPRLTSYLSPYAVLTILGCEKPDYSTHQTRTGQDDNQIIIDGPSFAYEIYNRTVANRVDALDTIPTYDEVGKTALQFLDELERCGLIM